MKSILLVLIVTLALNSYANIYQVGSTKTYVSPNALYLAGVLQDKDTIGGS